MFFANAAFLWGLLAAPIPIILHLFFRRRKTRQVFSSVQFFRPHERVFAYRRRLRQFLLLLLRTLALLLGVLALARPVLRGATFAGASRTDCVIILDDTLSMERRTASGRTAFQLAQARALAAADTLNSGDGLGVVWISGCPGRALARTHQATRTAIREAQPCGAAGSYADALQAAASLLRRATSANREIYLLTDFQRTQMPARPIRLKGLDEVRIFAVGLTGDVRNLSIGNVHPTVKPKIVDQLMTIPYEVRNHGVRQKDATIRLEIGGQRIAEQRVSLAPGTSLRGTFAYVPTQPGFLVGAVATEDRGATLDNRAGFAVEVREQLRVILAAADVYSRADPFFFLRQALAPATQRELNGFELESRYVAELTELDLRHAAALVLADVKTLSAAAARLIDAYLARGGTVVSFAGPAQASDAFAALSAPGLAGLYGPPRKEPAVGLSFAGPLAGLNEVLDLDLLHWRRRWPLTAAAGSEILATVDTRPMIVSRAVGNGRWIAFGCSARRDTGNWPELKSFPVAMIHLFELAARTPRDVVTVTCGTPVQLPADGETVAVADGAGRTRQLTADAGSVHLDNTWQPGVLKAEGSAIKAVIVNAAAAESDLTAMPADRAVAALTTHPARLLRGDADLAYQIGRYRRGSDLSGAFLLALLLVLTAEAGVGYGGRMFQRLRRQVQGGKRQ